MNETHTCPGAATPHQQPCAICGVPCFQALCPECAHAFRLCPVCGRALTPSGKPGGIKLPKRR